MTGCPSQDAACPSLAVLQLEDNNLPVFMCVRHHGRSRARVIGDQSSQLVTYNPVVLLPLSVYRYCLRHIITLAPSAVYGLLSGEHGSCTAAAITLLVSNLSSSAYEYSSMRCSPAASWLSILDVVCLHAESLDVHGLMHGVAVVAPETHWVSFGACQRVTQQTQPNNMVSSRLEGPSVH